MQLFNKALTRGVVLTSSLAMLVGVAACSGSSPAKSGSKKSSSTATQTAALPNGGTLAVGLDEEPPTLDAQKIDNDAKDFVTWSINEGLVDFNQQGKLIPQLAATVPVIDPSDPKIWTIP